MSEETQPQETQTEAAPSVTVNDLANIYAIIDLASKRGAFQANELQAVGSVANKVKAFVDHVQAQQAAAQEAEAPAEAAAS
jgi:hypothetical protein